MKATGIAGLIAVAVFLCGAGARAAPGDGFVTFESGQVRPVALSPNGQRLFAVNTPDNRLEMFDVTTAGLKYVTSVPVGLEPVALAARNDNEVWVVNHLSDSVSVVDVAAIPPRVTRTLQVGDEPRDIVFAGPGGGRAFITAAHRGQHLPFDPQLTTPGAGRADVWVFDSAKLDDSPPTIITLFGDTPRALAVTPDGNTVLAAVFQSGNRTTTLSEGAVCDGGENAGSCTVGGVVMPGGLPGPDTNFEGVPRPETGLIVKFNAQTGAWEDQLGRDWSPAVRFQLPDKDVFAIDATANPPVETDHYAGVGTVLFNMAVNPATGTVYVSNTDAHNEVRFEGPGEFGGSTVRGHLQEARITVIDRLSHTVTPRHLNKHIDYDTVPSPPGVSERSLATPLGMAVTSDGKTLYVAAFGSSAVGVFNTAALEDDSFVPDAASHIRVRGGGPSGLVLDEPHKRLYVLTRFDNSVSVVDTDARSEIAHLALHNPEPPAVVKGRVFLYDAARTSSNGEASCASCHIFGDVDALAWDLGNPDGSVIPNPNPFRDFEFAPTPRTFHPMKGPMVTQTLRGLAGDGPMHWRGDRTGGNDPGGDALDETAAFMKFNPAFIGLIGRDRVLTDAEMKAFTDFVLQITPPPNPIRALDNSLTPAQQAGRDFFFNVPTAGDTKCNGCHVLDPAQGFFGTDGVSSDPINFDQDFQTFKIPHMRNLYQSVGMFGMPAVPFFTAGDNGFKGDQIRGFGFLHDGSVDTIFRFLNLGGLDDPTRPSFDFPEGDTQRRQVEQFALAFDSNLAPIVGQQVTLTSTNGSVAAPRIDLLIARASAGECDVTVKGVVAGEERGWYRDATGSFVSDRQNEPPVADTDLRAIAAVPGQGLTYTCVPPGSGRRIGIDRDQDGFLDRDEIDAGRDPAIPACGGDCDNSGPVTIDEILRAVNIALGDAPITACAAGDINRDERITVDEVLTALNHALNGCEEDTSSTSM